MKERNSKLETRNSKREEEVEGRMKVQGELANRISSFELDRKSTRLNSSHVRISYAVFCLKKKKKNVTQNKTTLCKAIRSMLQEGINDAHIPAFAVDSPARHWSLSQMLLHRVDHAQLSLA